MGFFDGFFQSHWTHGNSIVGAREVDLGGFGNCGKLVYDDVNGAGFTQANGSDDGVLGLAPVPLLGTDTFMIVAFLRTPTGLVFDRLLFQVFEGFVDRGRHVTGLGFTDQGTVARADGNFGLVTTLLDRENDLGLKLVAQNFADFG